MSHKHTLENIRKELYIPTLFDRTSEATWMKKGRKEVHDAARDNAIRILKEHRPKPLDNDIKEKISEIVRRSEKELITSG